MTTQTFSAHLGPAPAQPAPAQSRQPGSIPPGPGPATSDYLLGDDPAMPRNYLSDMDAEIEKRTPDGDFIASILAADVVKVLRRDDPDLLDGWLRTLATHFIEQQIKHRDHLARQRQRRDARATQFHDAAQRHTNGDKAALGVFTTLRFVIDDANTRRTLGKMTAADHLYVAGRHQDRAAQADFEARFHVALAERIPDGKTTADALTENEYLALRAEIGGSDT